MLLILDTRLDHILTSALYHANEARVTMAETFSLHILLPCEKGSSHVPEVEAPRVHVPLQQLPEWERESLDQ